MQILMRILSSLTTVYIILIFIRLILSWFDHAVPGRSMSLLYRITDPYLGWFRRFSFLQTEFMDFSPIIALAVLALINNVFLMLAIYGRISIGIILSLLVTSLWSAVAFVLSFFIIMLLIRYIASLLGSNSVHPFWRAIDILCKPILYRVNHLVYRNRMVTYQRGIITTLLVLVAIRVAGGILINYISGLLIRLPI